MRSPSRVGISTIRSFFFIARIEIWNSIANPSASGAISKKRSRRIARKPLIVSETRPPKQIPAAIVKAQGFALNALTIQYGQRHACEVEAARAVARALGVERHLELPIDLRSIGGSALTSAADVPKDRDLAAEDIPSTYVPARNTIFLSYAVALAEVTGSSTIFIGVNALDYSGYPDCRPEYIKAFEKMANLATRAGVEGKTRLGIRTPLISLSKAAIIKLGTSLGVDYSLTTSCYDPGPTGEACGRCDACQLRLKGFSEAGLADPITYATSRERPLAGKSAQ